jgi:hypothetical protein
VSYYDDDSYAEPVAAPVGSIKVVLPSGVAQPVLNDDEAAYLTERVSRYHTDNALSNISDLQDLDRMLVMELMTHRWGIWIGQQSDYAGRAIDEVLYQRQLNAYSTELRQLKKLLGLDKPARDRQRGEGSIHHFWTQLGARAKAFGVMRVAQLDKALELTNELIGLVTWHKNSTEDERKEFHNTAEDILDWIDNVYRPEYEAIDAHFRANEQTYWIRTQ